MASAYNKAQRKKNLLKAIELRDAVVSRENHKTGKVERFRVSPRHIKEVTGIKAYEAFKLGVFTKPKDKGPTAKSTKQTQKKLGSQGTKTTARRIKEQ